ncbi:MAG: bifunctional DNA-formamidopyrimidine glycosylase/DNA-(apurinic or apyrimidinic site) lyase [Gammaproteobacteria bacterium]|nr:bifunctional DNA-formamidopyrimidine glycosylase/DNA-(apurinic or apyrimidinic site) lyase [Gammaproteobacteria bacterium]
MPELPEVETSRRGVAPWLVNQRVLHVAIREPRLRWPVPAAVSKGLTGRTIRSLRRRAKYLLIDTDAGSALLHLGMSGNLRIVEPDEPPGRHDHYDILLENGKALRFRDPRRFGSLLWAEDPERHPLLSGLGPEPLGPDFGGEYLWQKARGRRVAIKLFIMNASIVVGVGNIYANESLFAAGINPKRQAGRVSRERMGGLADAIRGILESAIRAGGTTLRDFTGGDGEPGYFRTRLDVYERDDRPCRRCDEPVSRTVLGQRSTYWCKRCQT